jgi:FkbM family methyltransferase
VQTRNDGGAIDIGANYGVYALTIAIAVGVDGRVFAFEPVAKTAGYLKQILDVNNFKQAEVLPFAISAAIWTVGDRIRLDYIPFGIHLPLNYPRKKLVGS